MNRATTAALQLHADHVRSAVPRFIVETTGLPGDQASGPALTAFLTSLQTKPHALSQRVLCGLNDILQKECAVNEPPPAAMQQAQKLPGQHPSSVQFAPSALLDADFSQHSVRACACEMLAHGVLPAIAALAAPRPTLDVNHWLALDVLRSFAAVMLSRSSPAAPALEACYAAALYAAGKPPGRSFQAAVNAAPLLAPSLACLVQRGVKRVPIVWIYTFVRLVSALAQRPATVLDSTVRLVNVLLEILDTRGADEGRRSDPLSRCAAHLSS